MDRCRKERFQQTRTTKVCVSVLGPIVPSATHLTVSYVSLVPEATHEVSRGPFKGAMSAQKAFQGYEKVTRELLGRTEENSISLRIGH